MKSILALCVLLSSFYLSPSAFAAPPNIEKLATQGTRFTQFSMTPVCATTRAALMTGRYHHSIPHNG